MITFIGFLLGLGLLGGFLALAIGILSIAAMWMIFAKAGESGWKSLIPVYNLYVMYRICWNTRVFWVVFVLEIVSAWLPEPGDGVLLAAVLSLLVSLLLLVIQGLYCLKLAGAFGKSGLFGAGLFFLNTLFILILGFGSSRYRGPQ